jgi:hypothetical protein
VYLQQQLSSEETVKAKAAFEAYSRSVGVKIEHYHADNGRFADNGFLEAVAASNQSISFCGVNAHFQSGIAEKRIRDLQDAARTQILHAKHRWSNAIEPSLWPYAIRQANSVHNSTTDINGGPSPLESFASLEVKPKLRHFHSFGCPVFVLHNNLQSGKTLPKWESRARVGINLGHSPSHARSVTLVLNLETGMVSPQYHVRFDDLFETVRDQIRVESKWQSICHFCPETNLSATSNAQLPALEPSTLSDNAPSLEGTVVQASNEGEPPPPGSGTSEEILPPEQPAPTAALPEHPPPALPTVTRSGRTVRPPAALTSSYVAHEALAQDLYVEEDKLAEMDDPILFAMKASNDPDTLYHHQAMREPDAKQFKEAMVKEVNDHTKRGHWEPMEKKSVPEGETILPAVWAMKRKRRIATREVYKWKSRLNLGGHKMIAGRHYDESYAPSLSWSTIRLFLTLAILHGWKTRQIDFVLAYCQAPTPRERYMELPKGVNIPGLQRNKHCLRIKKNIYGAVDAGRTWFLFLSQGLESLGFKQSDYDECVFYRGTSILLCYTDDCILLDKESDANIDKCIKDLKSKFDVEDEGTIEDYLGVQVTQQEDGSILLNQPQLIDSILKDLNLLDEDGNQRPNTRTKNNPSQTTKLVGPDLDGDPFDADWEYRSVIGKLNFLCQTTRGDISYQVHQCARFMSDPRDSHAVAIKQVGRYLLATRERGLIIKPNPNKSFECFVDADFCGNWDPSIAAKDPDTARSRAGYNIKYSGVPIYWSSKLINQVALSTAESELMALSLATRQLKPIMYLLEEINERYVPVATTPHVHCKLFEDNSAALEIARVPKMRPRTRHINASYHHFRSEVANKRIIILPIASEEQEADMYTHACEQSKFEKHRLANLGW